MTSVLKHDGARSHTKSFRLVLLLFLAILAIDAGRKVVGLPTKTIGVVYVITGLIYAVFLVRTGPRSRVAPQSIAIWLTILSLWCVAEAIIQRIPDEMALNGWASYVFFVPLLYVGADLMADDARAAKTLRIVVIAGGIVGLGSAISGLLGNAAPALLQPIIPTVGIHNFSGGDIYLAPSIFATGEEAAEQLLIAFFAWIALAHLPSGQLGRKSSAILVALIVGGLMATVRRTDIIVAVAGVIILLSLDQIYLPAAAYYTLRNSRSVRRGVGASLLFAAVGAAVLIAILGASKLVPFLLSGSPGGRLSLMFSVNNYSSIIGQGTGTSTQGANLVGATLFYGLNSSGPYTGYILNGRSFIAAEGGLTKTWLELGVPGVILYGGVFFSVLAPIARRLRRLDGAGRALTILTLALGIVFLKGHQDLDNPLVQPLFWLAAGGAWGRMRVLARTCGKRKHALEHAAVPPTGYLRTLPGPQTLRG
jgi:hypothetical protein